MKVLHFRERELARVDSLTGAATRLALHEFAADEVNRARRLEQPMTLAFLDIDGFKQINDHHGHSSGDRVLCAVAQVTRASLRRTDMVARVGGDEFALFLPNTEREAAGKLLEKLLLLLTDTMQCKGWPVTFSIGAITFCGAPPSVEEMVQRADEIMYSVKRNGKNRLRHEEIDASTIPERELSIR